MRRVRPAKWCGVSRSSTMLSSLPVTTAIGDGADYVDGLIPVEWRHLDTDDVRNFGELSPELVGEHAATNGGLQIETNHGKNLRDGPNVFDQLARVRIRQRGQAEQSGIEA